MRASASTSIATAIAIVRTVAPRARRRTTATIPSTAAWAPRTAERVRTGIARRSTTASMRAVPAVSARATTSHNGRVSHHPALDGAASSTPVAIATHALTPAIVRSTGMCQR